MKFHHLQVLFFLGLTRSGFTLILLGLQALKSFSQGLWIGLTAEFRTSYKGVDFIENVAGSFRGEGTIELWPDG